MKQLIQLNLTLVILFLSACSSLQTSSAVDNNGTYLQRNLDAWLANDWEPTVKEIDKNSSGGFKLQDYVDKAALYMKEHPSDENNSNVKKMEALPVIGK